MSPGGCKFLYMILNWSQIKRFASKPSADIFYNLKKFLNFIFRWASQRTPLWYWHACCQKVVNFYTWTWDDDESNNKRQNPAPKLFIILKNFKLYLSLSKLTYTTLVLTRMLPEGCKFLYVILNWSPIERFASKPSADIVYNLKNFWTLSFAEQVDIHHSNIDTNVARRL